MRRPRELVRPWGSVVGSAVHCSGVTSDNGPAVNGPAVTSRNCVLDPRKNETLDVVTSKVRALDMKTEVRFTFAGDVNSPRKHFYGTLNICILSTVTCI